MKITSKQIAFTGVLLALCIASQFLKNLSVFITGPIVNAILVIATLMVGVAAGVIISVVAPVTSFLITGSPIIAAIPWMIPMIMVSNVILVLFVYFFSKSGKKITEYIGMGVGSVIKAIFMWVSTSFILFPLFGESLKPQMIQVAKVTFSTTQLITAIAGCVLAEIIMIPLKKANA